MKNVFNRFTVILLLIAFTINSCKKDPVEPDPEENTPSEIGLILDQKEAYQYTTIVIEANKTIENFDNKILINGVESSAGVLQGKYIAFMIQPEITAGNKTLKLKVNGKDFEFPLQVKDLPHIADPKAAYTDYISFMETLGTNTRTTVEEVYKNAGEQPGPEFEALKNQLKLVNDSLAVYQTRFNTLSAEDQMIAAKIISAHKLKMQPVYDFMESHAEFLKDPNGFRKRAGICNIEGNVSASWLCVLNETKKQIAFIMKEAVINAVLGGATGAVVGTIFGPAGTAYGAAVGIATFQVLTVKLIIEFGCTLVSNFGSAFVATANDISARKSGITFINGEYVNIDIKTVRRNLQPGDKTSGHAGISSYLTTTLEFTEYVKNNFSEYIKSMPGFAALRQKSVKIENLEFIKIEVVSNSNVIYKGISGTVDEPKIKFATNEATDQPFEYKLVYDDGVFRTEQQFSGVVKSDVKSTLTDTLVSYKSHVINFKVEAPENVSWTLSDNADWMFTTVVNGTGTQNVQLSVQESWEDKDRKGSVMLSVNGSVIKTVQVTQQFDVLTALVNNGPYKITSFVVDGENMFKLHNTDFGGCDLENPHKEKVLDGTMNFSKSQTGSMVLNIEKHIAIFDDCDFIRYDISTDKTTLGLTWTFNANTSVLTIPQLVNDDEVDYKLTVSNGIYTLKSAYVEFKLEKL